MEKSTLRNCSSDNSVVEAGSSRTGMIGNEPAEIALVEAGSSRMGVIGNEPAEIALAECDQNENASAGTNLSGHALLRRAFIKSVPVLAGYVVLGIGFGILLRNAGYGVLWAFAMSVFIYAGSMQFVGVSLLSGGASVITTALTTFMVNARHLFYSISMIDRYKNAGKFKPYLIFALTDETYSLLCDGEVPEGAEPDRFRFFVSMFNQCYWVTGCVLGSLLGSVIPFSTAGIEFSMTALFISSYTEQWITTRDHIPALTGLISTLICLIIFGADKFLIPAMFLITAVLTVLRSREEGVQ